MWDVVGGEGTFGIAAFWKPASAALL